LNGPVTPRERSIKKPKQLPATSAGNTAFGPTAQQSAFLEARNKLDFPCTGEYMVGCMAIALPRLGMAGHHSGNSFTLIKIRIFCLPKSGGRMQIQVAKFSEGDDISLAVVTYCARECRRSRRILTTAFASAAKRAGGKEVMTPPLSFSEVQQNHFDCGSDKAGVI
jgi:hypothetical protein